MRMTRGHGWSSLCLRRARLELRQAAEERFPTGATTVYVYCQRPSFGVFRGLLSSLFSGTTVNSTRVVNEWVRGAGVNERQGNAGGLEQAGRQDNANRWHNARARRSE